jgi:hypothetical protein
MRQHVQLRRPRSVTLHRDPRPTRVAFRLSPRLPTFSGAKLWLENFWQLQVRLAEG